MKHIILSTILILSAHLVKAQTGGYIEFKPARASTNQESVPIPDFSSPPLQTAPSTSSSRSLLNSANAINAYYLDGMTNRPVTIKLKVIQNNYGLFIVGYKKLIDEYWTDLSSLPLKATKLPNSDKLSESFEFSTYLLSNTVYF